MNIKTLYSIFAIGCIVSSGMAVFQKYLNGSNLTFYSPFIWTFPLCFLLFGLLFLFITKFSYGVGKVKEITFTKISGVFAAVLAVAYFADFLTVKASVYTPLVGLESIFSILTSLAFLCLALVIFEILPLSFTAVTLIPIFYLIIKLINLFLSDIAIAVHPISSLNFLKTIFMLLFYLSFTAIFSKSNPGEKISNVIFITLLSSLFTVTSITFCFLYTPKSPVFSDIAFFLFSVSILVNLINAVIRTGKAIKQFKE